jgi:hypothetical protein
MNQKIKALYFEKVKGLTQIISWEQYGLKS